jgi:hypothetical protein
LTAPASSWFPEPWPDVPVVALHPETGEPWQMGDDARPEWVPEDGYQAVLAVGAFLSSGRP